MNKFILIALVATAFAAKCANIQELLDSNFDDYKLKYKISPDSKHPVSWPTDLTTAKNIGFDSTGARENCGANYCYIQTGENRDTTFKIKGFPKKGTVQAGIRIYSQDKKKFVSWNQAGFPQAGKGYYMYDTADDFIDGGKWGWYTLFAYNKDQGLEYMTDDKTFAPASALEFYEYKNYGGTHIFQKGGGTGPTQFCFVKVTDPTPPKVSCKVDDFSNTLQTLKAEFKETKCTAGNTIQENEGCEASCKNGFKGDKVNYICGADGNIKAETKDIVCTVPKTCAVDDQTPKLTGLNAEFKAKECLPGKTIDSGKTCTATCKAGKTGTVTTAKYTCNDGKLTSPTTIDCNKDSTKTCKVNDFVTEMKKLNAEVKDANCKAGSTIKENDGCEASCKNGKGDNVKYFCHDDGNFKPEAEAKGIACTSSFVQIGVLGALFCLFALN